MTSTVSVVVVTRSHPDDLRECLEHLRRLASPPHEVIVVDASPDARASALVSADFPEALLLRSEPGPDATPTSRRIGLEKATGDIVAFIEDDAYVDPLWLDALSAPYCDARVAGVGGRILTGTEGEETEGVGEIGRLLADGRLTENFAADPGRIIEVDHLRGSNTSFRRPALEALGGIRGNYPGTDGCEESDVSLRISTSGGTLVFQPAAIVRQAAPSREIEQKRFDRRALYLARRNHTVLLARVLGWRDPRVWHYARATVRAQAKYVVLFRGRLGSRRPDGSRRALIRRLTAPAVFTRSMAELVGLAAGYPAGWRARRRDTIAGPTS